MSSMLQPHAPSIQIGGPSPTGAPGGLPGLQGAPQGPGLGGPKPAGQGGDPIANVKAALNAALEDLDQAKASEHDPQDKALIVGIQASIHKLLGAGQAAEDSIMGGGPGTKLVRKATPPAAGPGY